MGLSFLFFHRNTQRTFLWKKPTGQDAHKVTLPALFYRSLPIIEKGETQMEYELLNGRLTVRVPRELDDHSAKELKEEIDRKLEEQRIRTLIFDFSDTGFMDSSGIGMILGRYKKVSYGGGKVEAIHLNERIRQMMRLSGLCQVIRLEKGGARKDGK